MRTTTRLLNGDRLTLEVPDAAGLPPASAVSVLSLDGTELEVTSGPGAALEHYLSMSGSELTGEVRLRTGAVLRHGRYGADPASGLVFAISVGEHELFGFTAAGMDVEALAAHLAQVGIEPGVEGPALTPGGSVTWSPYRTHTVAQVVELEEQHGYLLDVRRTRPGTAAPDKDSAGITVRGGRLSRSAVQERHAYAVLEADAFVSYGIPATAEHLDRVATSMAGVLTRLG